MEKQNTRTLHLTLTRKAFEVMVTGEKTEEYRTPSKWIERRLYYIEKQGKYRYRRKRGYDHVKFVNGYSKNAPYFIAEYRGFGAAEAGIPLTYTYSNGLTVHFEPGQKFYEIQIGKIIKIL